VIDSDKLAEQIAKDYLSDQCIRGLASEISAAVLDELEGEEVKREKYFAAYYKKLETHEVKFADMVRRHWMRQERIIIANLRKLKKAHMQKDAIDNVLPPKKEQEKKLAEEMKALLIAIISELGQEALDEMELAIAFDVTIPEVRQWVDGYAFQFAEKIEADSIDKLKRVIGDAMEEGKTIPEIIKDLRGQFDDWSKYRAEMVARTEANRASTRANLEAWRQSGVVKKKRWYANPDACPFCKPLDGKIITLEKTFFEKGDTHTATVDGKKRTMKLNYESVKGPPLHPFCRCSLLPLTK